ncbi:hypothetical protein BO94DRAFT_533899 [Aspergillus sclerotioniger CBS 115572]|uniref:F-box domain-containing protein n=1 Tax=Aspergillus sclerotioniger CBS 115572 TaxID=1450535 RepID=A0A317WVP0_9EURO|nr:hypothetical protein BO94DRAFT_533899 [Aspergillus sclerotioniger CBS 115572]PWY90419.1 hypothetical protein BO94DRAFT_533899 [Aspergillus sclerotioniger CBS 115572]
MTHSALNQVLSLPELLVQILEHLDIRNLLLAQRVCRKWANQIQHSPSLQKALFLAPSRPTGESPIYNSVLREEFLSFFPDNNDPPSYLRVPGDCYPPLDMPVGRSFPPDSSAPQAPSRHPVVDDASRAGSSTHL